jgi:hypothetical protein
VWRNPMSCACGEKYQRTFPAKAQYTVFLDRDRKASPVQWAEDTLAICVMCGDVTGIVPAPELEVLRRAGGESNP